MVDTLHPIYEGGAFTGKRDSAECFTSTEYESTQGGERADRWRSSPFYYLLKIGGSELRRRIGENIPSDFTMLDDLRAEGHTDYFAILRVPALTAASPAVPRSAFGSVFPAQSRRQRPPPPRA